MPRKRPRKPSQELELKLRLLWTQACMWEGLHPVSPFVVFSPNNPYQEEYEEAYRAWKTAKEG